MALSAQKSEIYHVGPGEQDKHILQLNNAINKKKIINTLRSELYGDDPFATFRLPESSLSTLSLGK